MNITYEFITFSLTTIATISGYVFYIYKKFIKPSFYKLSKIDSLQDDIGNIKKELTYNGGSSMKDTLSDLRRLCKQIDENQKINHIRTKVFFNFIETPMFETDTKGQLLWYNTSFLQLIDGKDAETLYGFNWLNYIEEQSRHALILELNECVKLTKKLEFSCVTLKGNQIVLSGIPLKTQSLDFLCYGYVFYIKNAIHKHLLE